MTRPSAASAVSFLCFVFLSSASAAAPVHWEPAGWEGGGCYPNIEPDPSVENRVYLTSDVAGIWRSDDLGEHWRFVTHGLGNLTVSLVVVAPSDSNTLYAGTQDGVFYSRSAGEEWMPADDAEGRLHFTRPESHRAIAVSKTDASRLIAGSSTGWILYSQDHGKKWERLGSAGAFEKTGPITAMVWLEKENILYASSDQGVAVFSFKSSEWNRCPTGPTGVTDLWADPASPDTVFAAGQNKLFVSRDRGKTWSHGSVIPNGVLFRLLVPDGGKKTMFAAWNDGWKGGILLSEDEGAHWKPWDKKMNMDSASDPTRAWAGVHGRINALKADPFHKNILFRTDWWGVWRSDDGGVTWDEKIKGAPNTVASDVAVSENGEIYVATMDNGLLKSRDGGKTYETLFPAKEYKDDVNGHVWRVLTAGGRIFALSAPWNTDYSQVIVSRDGGATFEKYRTGLPEKRPKVNTVWDRGYARAMALDPKKPDTLYLGIDGNDGGGFFISKDGGQAWERSKNQPGSLQIYSALEADPKDPARLLWGASGKGAGIYFSEDGGNSWRLAAGPPMKKIFDLRFGPGGRVYAAGEEDSGPVLYSSEDRGKNWGVLKKFEGPGGAKGLCVLPDGRVAVGTVRWHGKAPGHVYLGSADGKTWEVIDGDLPEGEGPAALAYDEKEKTLYLARFAGSVYKARLADF